MRRNQEKISATGSVVLLFVLLNTIVLEQSFLGNNNWNNVSYVSFPLLLLTLVVFRRQKK